MGVPKNNSQEEIKKAFRKLARQFHPDVAKYKAQAEEKFKEINEAHEVLGDALTIISMHGLKVEVLAETPKDSGGM